MKYIVKDGDKPDQLCIAIYLENTDEICSMWHRINIADHSDKFTATAVPKGELRDSHDLWRNLEEKLIKLGVRT
jgi:predicted nuclease with RNAse H fold